MSWWLLAVERTAFAAEMVTNTLKRNCVFNSAVKSELRIFSVVIFAPERVVSMFRWLLRLSGFDIIKNCMKTKSWKKKKKFKIAQSESYQMLLNHCEPSFPKIIWHRHYCACIRNQAKKRSTEQKTNGGCCMRLQPRWLCTIANGCNKVTEFIIAACLVFGLPRYTHIRYHCILLRCFHKAKHRQKKELNKKRPGFTSCVSKGAT